jgi:exodeoxyribonuclease V beta subunit
MSELDPWRLPLGGTALIEASAGTGKTYTLTTLYLRLLVEEDLRPGEILVVTYTTAATAELRERVRARIQQAIRAGEADARPAGGTEGEPSDGSGAADEAALRELAGIARRRAQQTGRPDALRRALREFDEAAIFTIHGFCQRTLREHAFESGAAFDAELVEQSESIQRTLAQDLWVRLVEGENPRFVEWLLDGGGRRWQFEPEALYRDLLRNLGADEQMPILPGVEPTGADDDGADDEDADDGGAAIDAAFQACRGAWDDWAEAWPRDRDARIDWLLDPANLDQRTHKTTAIQADWIPFLEERAAALAGGQVGDKAEADATSEPLLELPGWWEKLGPAKLAEKRKKTGIDRDDPFFKACAKVQQAIAAVESVYRSRALRLRHRFVEQAREESRRRRNERHLLFFDDLLSELREALQGVRGERLATLLRSRMPFALIDEFQDTDPVQYDIFRRVWHQGPARDARGGLLLIGDPKQAIYSFRGADVFTYLRARADTAREPWTLSVSYRSDPGLIHALNALFARPERAFGIEGIDFHPVSPRPGAHAALEAPGRSRAGLRVVMAERASFPSELEQPDESPLPLRFGRTDLMTAFAQDVAELLECGARIDGRPLAPSDIAVLCRKKSQIALAREALLSLGIPCVDRGERDVFESREAWELACVLRAMLHPGDPARLRAALATSAHGLDAAAIDRLGEDSAELASAAERFAEYGRLWSEAGLVRALERWRREEGALSRLLALEDGERRVTNWLHLVELLQGIALERGPSREGLVGWLERAIADEAVRSELGSEASLLRLERDDEAVSLMTLHGSKGLEFEIVYLPSLWESWHGEGLPSVEAAREDRNQNPPVRFHDASSGLRSLDLGGPEYAEHVKQAGGEEQSEALRLLYVALTRARRQCVVYWGAIGREYSKSPLAALLDAWGPTDRDRDDPPAERREDRAKRIGRWPDSTWSDAWQALGGAARRAEDEGEAFSIEPVRLVVRGRWRASRPSLPPLVEPGPLRDWPRAQRTTSFSGLVRGAPHGASSGPWAIGRDFDALVDGEGTRTTDEARGPEARPGSDLVGGMDAFPRGAEAGTLLHEVLEAVRFDALDEARIDELAREALTRNGLDLELRESVRHVVHAVARTPLRLEPAPFRLADVAPGRLRPELEFTLAAPGDPERGGFEPHRLAALLESAPPDSPLARYAPRLGRLDWGDLQGHLRGFIDAVFHDGERYFLIDYKSNHLGGSQADYRPERLLAPMIEHDYVLQYLIYSVALDRHLGRTLEDYHYERHFGGAYYLFLRGLAPEHEPGCGIFFDRPEEATIRGVSALLGGAWEADS